MVVSASSCGIPGLVRVRFKALSPYAFRQPWNSAAVGIEWFLTGKGLCASNQFEVGGFIRTRADVPHPDMQFHFLAGCVVGCAGPRCCRVSKHVRCASDSVRSLLEDFKQVCEGSGWFRIFFGASSSVCRRWWGRIETLRGVEKVLRVSVLFACSAPCRRAVAAQAERVPAGARVPGALRHHAPLEPRARPHPQRAHRYSSENSGSRYRYNSFHILAVQILAVPV